jgi:hypothetical protein
MSSSDVAAKPSAAVTMRANKMRAIQEGLETRCPFCREPIAETDKVNDLRSIKRIKASDPDAPSA